MNKRTILVNSEHKEVVSIEFTAEEPWITVKCADGAVVKLKAVIKEVLKFTDILDDQGNSTYNVPFSWVMHIIPPPMENNEFKDLKNSLVN